MSTHRKRPKPKYTTIGLALALFAWAPAAASAATAYYVDRSNPSCSDTGAGTEAQPYCTINGAVAARKGAGITILVKPGVYREQITVPASGAAGDTFAIRALGAAIIDGADDVSVPASWTLVSGNVYLASSVNWTPGQVFVDGVRLTNSTASPSSMPSNTYQYVSGTGLYVNVGGGNPGSRTLLVSRRAYGFRVDKRSWVSIEGFTITRQNDRAIYLTGPLSNDLIANNTTSFGLKYGVAAVSCSLLTISKNVASDFNDAGVYLQGVSQSTIADNESFRNFRPLTLSANGIYLTGCNGNTLLRNRTYHNQDTGLHFQSCINNVCVQNLSWGNGDHGIDHLQTTGTRHVGDVTSGNFRCGFMVQNSSTGTAFNDCVAINNGLSSANPDFSVDASSSSQLQSDYNLFWNAGTAPAPIRFENTSFASAAAFNASAGFDAHSWSADPLFADTTGNFEPQSGSPLIDAGISSVASWPSADFRGRARFDDPQATNRGAGSIDYADIGAFEFKRNLVPVARLSVAPVTGFPPLAVTADGSASTDADGSVVSYTFDFGDGTVVGPQASPTATHSFNAGNWLVILTAKDDKNAIDTMAVTVSVAPNRITNGSFETNTTGWNAYASATIARVAGGQDGAWAVQITGTATTTATFGVNDSPNWVNGVSAGSTFRYTAWVRSDSHIGAAKLHVREYFGTPSVLKGEVYSTPVTLSPTWQQLTVDYVVLNTGATIDFQVQDFPRVLGEVFLVDNCAARVVGADTPPAITVPATVSVIENTPLTLNLTAADADNDVITALAANLAALPVGHNAVFTAAADKKSGTLTWTPTYKDSGAYNVVFSATNAQTGTATTRIQVVNADRKPIVTAPATVNGSENAPLTVTLTAADPDSDAIASLVANLSGLPAGNNAVFTAAADKRSGTLTWTPTFADSGHYSVTFTASNGASGVATTSISISDADRAPIATVAATAQVNEGAPLTLTVTASDPDGQPIGSLAANLAVLPAGNNAVFTPSAGNASGTLTWTPTYADSGIYNVVFTASNGRTGTAACAVHVNQIDRAPVVTAPAAVAGAENGVVTVNVSASDLEGDAITSLTANLSGLPAGNNAVFTPAAGNASGTLTWTTTFADSGHYTVGFTAANSLTGSASTVLTIANVDRAPAVVAPPTAVTSGGNLLTIDVTASDLDGDAIAALTADLGALPAGNNAVFTPAADRRSGRLTWTPGLSDGAGPYAVRFTASNALSGQSTTSISVDKYPVVAAPVNVTGLESAVLTINVSVSDPDGQPIDTLTVDLSGLPAGHDAVFTSNPSHTAGTLTWTPSYDAAPGPYTVRFTAHNALSASAFTAIDVTNKDRAPVLTAPSIKNSSENLATVIDVVAGDLDGDGIASLTADLSHLPAGNNAVFTPAADRKSGQLTWTPTYADSGAYDVVFTGANALSGTVTTHVVVANTDRAPVVSAAATAAAREDSLFTLVVTASDPDGDAITTFAPNLATLPAGHNATWTPAADHRSGTLTWRPTFGDASGPYAIAFTASNALAATGTTAVSVQNVDRPPFVHGPGITTVRENDTVTVEIAIGDPDGEPISSVVADLSALPPSKNPTFTVAPDKHSATLTWSPSFDDQGGPYPVSFTATNSLSGTSVTQIQVSNVDRSPVVTAPVSATGDENHVVTVNVSAADPDGEAILALTADLSALPAGNNAVFTMGPSASSGTLTWTPTFADSRVQTYDVVFTASNSFTGSATTPISIRNVDRAPVVTVAANETATENAAKSITVTVADPDGDAITALTANLTGLPAGHGAVFTPAADQKSGILTWTPSYDAAPGPWAVSFTATNALTGSASSSIAVTNVDRPPVVVAPTTVTAAQGQTMTLQISAADLDGDAIASLTAALNSLPPGNDAVFTAATDKKSGTLTWTPTLADGGATFTVAFVGENTLPGSASTTIIVDRHPVVGVVATASGAENSAITLTVNAADPDGQALQSLTANLSGLPAGHGATFVASPDNSSGTFTWTPSYDAGPGPYTVRFSAANSLIGSAQTSISVTNVDRAPVVTAPATATGSEGSAITVNLTAVDPDGDPIDALEADLSGLPAGTFTPAADHKSGTLSWTPVIEDGPGPYTVSFTAHNVLSGTRSTSITVQQKPVLTVQSNVSVAENALLTLTVNAADPDGQAIGALTADLSGLPAGHNATFTTNANKSQGTLTWRPTFTDGPGNFSVTFTAANDLSQTATTQIGVTNVDRAPVVVGPATAKTAQGRAITITVTASDPDGQPVTSLSANLSALPAGHNAVFTEAADHLSGSLTWTPTLTDGPGPYNVVFSGANVMTGTFTTAITVNQYPVVTVPATVSVTETSTVIVNVSVSDSDGEAIGSLTADLSGLPAGHNATFSTNANKTAGTLIWTPTYDDAPGPYSVSFTASNTLTITGSTSITVVQRDRNPVVTAPTTASGTENAPLTVNVTANDPDGDAITTLTADLTGLPGGQFTPAADRRSGVLSWTPQEADQRGPYTVLFTASNALSGSASSSITIEQYPVFTVPSSVSVNEDATLSLNLSVTDPDGDPINSLTADLTGLPAGASATFTPNASKTSGLLTWRPGYFDAPGPYTVSFTAQNGLTRTASTMIAVVNMDRAPAVTAPATAKVSEGAPLTINVTAADPDNEGITTLAVDTSQLPAGHNAVFTVAADKKSGTFTWTPTLADGRIADYAIGFTATNALSGTTTTQVKVDQAPEVTSPGSVTASENSAITIHVTVNDPDTDAITSLIANTSGLPVGHNAVFTAAADKKSGDLVWTPTFNDFRAAPYTVSFTATNTQSGSSSTSVTVNNTDRAPAVLAPVSAKVAEGSTVTVSVTAADPDGDAISSLAADLANLPGGHNAVFTAAADKRSGTLTWTPTAADGRTTPYVVTFNAGNVLTGSGSVAITVDQPPVITVSSTFNANENEVLTVHVAASDPDGDPITALTGNLSSLPAGNDATFTTDANKTTGTLTWKPTFTDAPGSFAIGFTASNVMTTTGGTTIQVVNVDRAPVVVAPGSASVGETSTLTINVTASDADGEAITSIGADLSSLPAGHNAVFSPGAGNTSGVFTWTPTFRDAPGPYNITFTATNAKSGSITMPVTVINLDRPPVLAAPVTVAAGENVPLLVVVTASDVDLEPITTLTADLSSIPSGQNVTFTTSAVRDSGYLRWTPSGSIGQGPYVITFTAANGRTVTATTSISVDRAPRLTAPATASASQGVPLSVQVTVTEPDNEAIQSLVADLSAIPASEGATFTTSADKRTGTLSWTPTLSSGAGPFDVTFSATNSLSNTARTTIRVDQAPIVTSTVSVSTPEASPVSVVVGVQDPDNDAITSLTADLSALPAGNDAVFTTNASKTSGSLTWTPSYFAAPGPYVVTFRATNALSRTSTSTIAVTNVDRAPTMSAASTAVVGENSTISLHVSAADPDNEAITSITADLSQLPAGHDATFTPDAGNLGGTLTWKPTFNDGRPSPYVVSFTASNARTVSASTSISVESRPTVTAPANSTIGEGFPVTFTVTANDPDGQPIQDMYANMSGLPAGNNATFVVAPDKRSGVFSWTPTYVDSRSASYFVTFTATNNFSGAAVAGIKVLNTDRAPVVVSPDAVTVAENTPATVNVTASDPDGQTISSLNADLSALAAGHNAAFTPNASKTAGTLTWTPQSSDGGRTFSIVFTAANVMGGADTTRITVDRYPVLTVPASASANEGALVTVNVTAVDADGQPITGLTADLSGLPSGHNAVFTPNANKSAGTLTWTPGYNDSRATPYTIVFSASNVLARTASTSITVANTDRAPVVTAPATFAGSESAALSLTMTAADPDGQALTTLTANLSSLPAGSNATFTANASKTSGTLTWTPTLADSGSYPIVFTSTNALNGTATTTLRIANSDRAPVVVAPATASGPENGPISVHVTASDADGDAISSLTANVSGLPAGHNATFTPDPGNVSGTLTWTPSFAAARASAYNVTFTASNATNGTATTAITVTNVDRLATVSSPAHADAFEGAPVTINVSAADADGDALPALGASFNGLPAGNDAHFTAAADHASGAFTWTPSYEDAGGPYTIVFSNGVASSSTEITVAGTDRAPIVVVPSSVTAFEGQPLSVHVSAADLDGQAIDHLTASLVGLPAGHNASFTVVNGDTAATLAWTPTFNDGPGTYTVALTASNVLTTTATVTIHVQSTNQPPIAALTVTPTTGQAPIELLADASGSHDPDGSVASYTFDFGDGTVVGPQGTPTATHIYNAGHFTASVIVEDNLGGRDTASVFVSPYENFCTNGDFETGFAGWITYQDSLIAKSTTGRTGLYALKCLQASNSATKFGADDSPNFVTNAGGVGSVYHYEMWVRSGSFHSPVQLQIRELSGGTVRATVLSPSVTLESAWQLLSLDYRTTFANTALDLKVICTPLTKGEWFFVDDVMVRLLSVKKPVVTAPATTTVAENGLLSLAVTATDPDGEPLTNLVADVSQLPAGSNAFFSVNGTNNAGTLTWTPTFDHGRAAPYNVTFLAMNADSGSATTAITVNNVDRAPVVTAPATLTSGEGTPITVNVSVSEPDGQPITSLIANFAGLPSGHNAVFTPAAGNLSGVLHWTPTFDDSGGPYPVTFTASNALSASATTSIRITAVDRAPSINVASRFEAIENEAASLPVTAVDLDGQTITSLRADLSGLPSGSGAVFTVAPGNGSGTLAWTPTSATPHGPFIVTFTAENVKSFTAPCTLTVDHYPVVTLPSTLNAAESSPATFNVTVTDPDNDPITSLTADLSSLPVDHNAQFTTDSTRHSGVFTWTPTHRDAGGPYPVRITAVNGHPITRTVNITVADVDAAPEVVAPTSVSATENQPVSVHVTASEPDGQAITSLTADLSSLPGGHNAVFTADPGNTSGTLTWTPSFESAPGPYHITFSASNALTGSTKTTISVANVDRAPIISAGTTATANEGSPFTLAFTAIDPDGTPITSLTASLSGLPPGHNGTFTAGANNATGTFTWTPTFVDAVGPYNVTFTAQNTMTTTRTVAIRVDNTDRPPVVTAPIVGGGREGAPVVVDITTSDPDGAQIFLLAADVSGLPSGNNAQFTPAADNRSGRLTWTPAAGDSVRGPFHVTFTATNASTGSASTTLMVGSQDFAPMVAAPSNATTNESSPITIQVQAGDPNGDAITSLSANLSGLPAGSNATFTPNANNLGGSFTWTPTFADARTQPYSVTFTASNTRSGSVTTSITVTNVDRAPVVTAPASVSIADGSPVTVNVTAADADGQAITSLTADLSGLPVGNNAVFTPGAGNTSGVLTWTPTPADVRAQAYSIGFVATNALSGGASTQITVMPRDRTPVVTVASTIASGEGQAITLTLTAADPDGQAITSLTANLGNLPAGHNATFTANAGKTGGTFTWTPTFSDARPAAYNVTFTAANALSGTATTAITINNVDRAPVVTAPATASVIENAAMTINVTAGDPDGTAITTLTADLSAFPTGNKPVFTTNAGKTAGTLTWTPSSAEVRTAPYNVVFSASNALTGTATSAVTVAPSNLAPNATLASPNAAVVPGSEVALSAAGSSDPDGTIASYTFDFGDGATLGPQSSPTATHVYAVGGWTASVVIVDDKGARDTAAVDVNANLPNLVSNFGFETNTTGWSANGSVTLSRVTTAPHSGTAAMQLKGGSSATATFGTTSNPNPVTAVAGVGRRYRFGAWIKGSTTTDTGSVAIEVREFSGTSTQRGTTAISSPIKLRNTIWQYVTVDYVVTTASTNLNMRLIDTPKKASETWFLDDVTCALVPLGDQAPLVTAPASISVVRNHPLTVNVTAADPDGNAITGLTANLGGLPAGHNAVFTSAADKKSGTLTWTPTAADIRSMPFNVTFTASNALSGIATTAVTVTDSATTVNLVTNPGFETDLSGWGAYSSAALSQVAGGHSGGFCVRAQGPSTASFGIDDIPNTVTNVPAIGTVYRFSAWIRSDNSTRAVKLRIYEMQGGTQVGATFYSADAILSPTWKLVTVDYTTQRAGTELSLRITDYPTVANEVFFIDDVSVELVPAGGALTVSTNDDASREPEVKMSTPRAFATLASPVRIEENRTWSAQIEGLDGPEFEGSVPAITVRAGEKSFAADAAAIRMGDDTDANGFEEIQATFPIDALRSLASDDGSTRVQVTVEVAAGTPHARSIPMTIEIVPLALRFEAVFGPNPMRARGTLFFAITRPGAVLAEVFDASGRRVRTLVNEPNARPGRFALELDGRGDHGERLPAGLYFYRLNAAEGRLGGRIVIVR
jgi:parallel beta-helix repeat protein